MDDTGHGLWWALVLVLLLSTPVAGASLRLAWDASARATAYKLYYGTTSGHYTTVLDTGPLTQAEVSGLSETQTYVFAATAYNVDGESDYSNEVSAMPKPEPPQDTIPPLVRIMSPRDGETVARRMTTVVVVEATDTVGVVSVGVAIAAEQLWCTGTGLYTCSWRVPAANKRRYALQAFALDAANNQGVSPMVEVTAE